MKLTIPQAVASALVIAIAAAAFLTLFPPQPVQASGVSATPIGVATTSAAFAVTTSARVLATTTNTVGTGYTRVYATVCNANANPVALNMDGDKLANAPGGAITVWIAAAAGYQACYEITDRNQYSGSITASSTNQTSTTVTVKDYVQ